MPRTRPPYDLEFRRETVGLMTRGERSLVDLSAELGVSVQTLRNWRRRRVKRELRVVTEEREILKKALAFFATDDRR